MASSLYINFAQGVLPRRAKTAGTRNVSPKQRLIVRATAGIYWEETAVEYIDEIYGACSISIVFLSSA